MTTCSAALRAEFAGLDHGAAGRQDAAGCDRTADHVRRLAGNARQWDSAGRGGTLGGADGTGSGWPQVFGWPLLIALRRRS